MRVRSCLTTAPAPRLRCPTSLLPIWPSGRPTALPPAVSCVCGYLAQSASNTGVSARSTALPGPGGAMPHPSRMTSTTLATGRVIRPLQREGAARRVPARDASPQGESSRGLDDRDDLLDVQRRAADEAAVAVGQRQQLGGVVGLHRAAVEH